MTAQQQIAFECPGAHWRPVAEGQRVCPNCGRAIVVHRVITGELAKRALARFDAEVNA